MEIRRHLPILDWITLGSRNNLLLLCLSARRRVAKANLISSMLHARYSADDDVARGSRKEALMCAASYIDQEHGLVAIGIHGSVETRTAEREKRWIGSLREED